ncbi:protein transport protein Sec31A isoform X2 [Carassius auratus]|uniref:Protein transport protein Sec31A n=1 Tax=Carassius auratus TaxID=7957 RepID=A0A6P6QIA7_CARAU|nr:protein transport protein Sec31A-like isoform X2 [Carassius auratus]
MRVKEILRTATQAWSPAAKHPTYLALGTAAQQLDASFNTSAALEIFEVDFADTSMDMKLRGTLPTSNRFHSLIWVAFDLEVKGSSGRLIGGSESGSVTVFSPDVILSAGEDAVIGQSLKHTGPVRALDYNRFQSNLIASGASDSEIYIWDLNNFSNPMTPGAKSQPAEDVSVVAWNSQVQHILASANPSGKAIVWDLRKNEPIIKISDHSNRMHCSGMLWHPDVATQLVLASEDDRLPVIQMWDLRFATSPLKVLESHTRGILSISWSQADPELLLSSGKDNRILCWNPNTGEVIYELPTANQWCFDVQWCPRNPALLSAASFDGRISVYSVMGGRLQQHQHSTVDQISASFDTSDPFGTGQALPPLQVPQPTVETTIIPPLRKPPKWVRRPVGASFAFGGKLVTFENPSVVPQQQQPIRRQVQVSQVTTETEFLHRSSELQAALQSGSFTSYCQDKIRSAPSDAEQDIWRFLMVNFEEEARVKFLRLLGFSKDELQRKISACLGRKLHPNGLDVNDLTEKMQTLSDQRAEESGGAADGSSGRESPADFFSQLPKKEKDRAPFQIPVSSDTDGLISQALLVGNFEGAVDLCLNDGRFAEAILLSISGGEELLKKTQQHYLHRQTNSVSMLISSVVTQNWRDIVQSCELDNWKEALAALLTYANPEEFASLCNTLGSRLQAEGTEKRCLQACLCFICSGNIERLVECWTSQRDCSSPLALEDLVEKVMILRKSIERLRNGEVCVQSSALTERLVQYSSILASQGSLTSALRYLPDSPDQPGVQMLRERLSHAKGEILQRPQPSAPAGGAKAPANTLLQHTPAAHTQGPPQMQQMMPRLFTPQPRPDPSTPAGAPRPSLRPSVYPQHPATAPGFAPSQPFAQSGSLGALGGFMSGPSMSGPSMSGPSMSGPTMSGPSMSGPSMSGPTMSGPSMSGPSGPPSSPPGPMMPAPPGPGFISPTSLPGGPVPFPAAPPSGAYLPLGAGYPPGGPGAPGAKSFSSAGVPPPPTGYFPWLMCHTEEEVQDGWNDPPAVRSAHRKKKLPENYTPPAPITAPVMGFPVEAPVPQDRIQVPPGAPQEPSKQSLQQLPAERVGQKEIPAEHMILKTTFSSLVQRCQLAAADPQTKRKLDDASKRLESLYDKLRDQALSPSILGGLHEISRCVSVRNYHQGLEVHTQVVSSSNFSEISAFMPVLKMLMTIANKLAV